MSTNGPAGPPPGQTPPYGWPPQSPPPQGGSSAFFDSLRRSGWYRADNRVLGGVCSGVSARTGWDLGLVRGATVVLAIFFSPVWIAYGVAWALLPEQRDGRIHLEQLIDGHLDIAQLGALAMLVLGIGNPLPWATGAGGWFVAGLIVVGIVVAIAAVASSKGQDPRTGTPYGPGGAATPSNGSTPPPAPAFAQSAGPTPGTGPAPAFVAPASGPAGGPAPVIARNAAPAPGSSGSGSGPTDATPGTPSSKEETPMPDTPPTPDWRAQGGPVPPGQPFAAPGPQGPAGWSQSAAGSWSQQGPMPAPVSMPAPPPRRRPVSARVNLLVTGLVVLVIAVALAVFLRTGGFLPLLGGGAVCLLIVGAALGVASVRDRGAGWLIALSVIGAMIGVPAAIGFTATRAEQNNYGATSGGSYAVQIAPAPAPLSADWTVDELSGVDDSSSDGGFYGTRELDLDLTGAPEDTDKTITVTGPFQNLNLDVRQGQSVQISINGYTETVTGHYYAGSQSLSDTIPWVPEVSEVSSSLAFRTPWWSADHAIRVNITDGSGAVQIYEKPPASAAADQGQSGAQSGDAPQSGAPTPSPSASTTDRH